MWWWKFWIILSYLRFCSHIQTNTFHYFVCCSPRGLNLTDERNCSGPGRPSLECRHGSLTADLTPDNNKMVEATDTLKFSKKHQQRKSFMGTYFKYIFCSTICYPPWFEHVPPLNDIFHLECLREMLSLGLGQGCGITDYLQKNQERGNIEFLIIQTEQRINKRLSSTKPKRISAMQTRK